VSGVCYAKVVHAASAAFLPELGVFLDLAGGWVAFGHKGVTDFPTMVERQGKPG